MNIVGAGLAGLLAGSLFQRATLFESGDESQLTHKAVLRFRSPAVGEAVGIEFKAVTVHKGIWLTDKFVRPSIQLANIYSNKVIGLYNDRSIWSIDPVQRFIAPENIVEQLAERCTGRIKWNSPVDESFFDKKHDTISTAPMPSLASLINPGAPFIKEFKHAPIVVRRWRIPNSDLYQTIYFPEPTLNLYRASITGSLLIAEYMRNEDPTSIHYNRATRKDKTIYPEEKIFEAFGITSAEPIDKAKQKFGKIAPVDEYTRRQFILHATLNHRVYSLGRFATWRNILLDDVLKDINVIKRLITGGAYAATRKV